MEQSLDTIADGELDHIKYLGFDLFRRARFEKTG